MNQSLGAKKVVRLFKNGRSQAIRIPKEMQMQGNEVQLEKDWLGRLVITPLEKRSLVEVLAKMKPLEAEEQLPAKDDSDLLPLVEPDL